MKFIDILKITTPVALAYIPLGMAFGIFAVSYEVPWYFATLMSLIVYAGSAEFLIVAFIISFASILEVFIAIFLVNLRHFFYGISILNDFKNLKGFSKIYSIFGLTDETFALLKLVDIKSEEKQKVYPIITALGHLYWVFGVFLGSFFGQFLKFDSKGLNFILTALFIVLSIELYNKVKQKNIVIISIFISIFGLFLPDQYMLVITLLISASILILFKDRIKI
ncbi:AzlC family ABC transporter permease [Aliarcobacter skirrowii]|uniref:AzlC family ABC transporter permease n=1 Tax=Aliarcobacter skirrowii TaxID=28200 RepID=UPI000D60E1C1|nr:AzlC family ABC transporter permease [Aliarcobacter skirrowii]MDX4037528.1 AzlC family ABC transporter permease [Aliarcobacter skirrowii]PWE20513.1 branched-chain amino acid ABC transporter permease [Aliarcobacter skirrowii]PWE25694.1 branched-chain amino acid ABC transporter permease [Aliarcobacter skirrowii]RJO55712.1 branched-chain amino acid ABC transporter permease [Aliarcobacter skirrowii]RJO57667.1 branched-chain amino acid ABC transporter permease [Aliarcobacter skirrowii]